MSGGIAYVLDISGRFRRCCNQEMVDLEPLDPLEDSDLVRALIQKHVSYTDSDHAARVLDAWSDMAALFVKVMPRDYKRVLAAQAQAVAEGRTVEFSELVGVAVAHG